MHRPTDAVVVTDAQGRILDWYATGTDLTADFAATIRGRRVQDLAAELGADAGALELLRRAFEEGEPVAYEARREIPGLGPVELAIAIAPINDGEGRRSGAMLTVRDVTALREAERDRDRAASRARFLAEVSRVLAGSLDLGHTLDALGSLVVPEHADVCGVGLLEDGKLEAVSVTAWDPALEPLIRELFDEHTRDPVPGGFVERALQGGSALLVPDYQDRPVRPGRRSLREAGVRSVVVAPLQLRGRVHGLLFALTAEASGRRFADDDVDLLGDVADRAVQAIENARLYRAERQARAVAELAERAAREAEERFRAAFDHAPVGIALLSLDAAGLGRFVEVNPALCEITGRRRGELLGRPAEFLGPVPWDASGAEGERRLVRADGEERWVQVRAAPLAGASGGVPRAYVAQVEDVTDRRRFEHELEHLASHDPLTGLLNRRRFGEELEQALAHVRRHGEPAAVVTLDLDGFKHVNDTYGHAAGDELLRATARALTGRVRDTDAVGRLGGDEFGMVLRHSGAEEAAEVARQILEELRTGAGVLVGERTVRVTASAGVRALDADSPLSAGELLGEADLAMYEAKELGRDRLAVAGEGAGRTPSRLRWVRRVREALDCGRFVLHEQPIVRLSDGRADRAELLLRMLDDDGALIPPKTFLPVAERFGQVTAIDRWVVREAVALLAERRRAGCAIGAEVNLSGDSLSDPVVIDEIVAEVRASGIDCALLTFEVTETAAIGNLDRARKLANQLSELGCAFALDDFGAGFGSFAYLKHLPVDTIKIDGDFVCDLPASPADQVTVRAIVDVAKGLGKQTVAEYVQDDATVHELRRLGVDRAQGHHLGRPRQAATWPAFAQR